jgi:hypothetical protein
VVQIIEAKEDAGAQPYIELRVYRSPMDPNRVLGEWQYAESVPIQPKGAIAISQSKLGTPIVIEFQRVVSEAHRCNVPFVWVNDPEGLFPPPDRPTFQVVP